MKKKGNLCILYVICVTILVMLDQFTKYLAVSHLKNGSSIILIQDVFQLHYLENRGAAFGLLQGQKLWFVISTSFMMIFLILVYLRTPSEKKYHWIRLVLILLTAGAIGNLIDRLRLDYVIDFFYFEWIDFPVFNVADIYVTVGMAILIFLIFFYYKEEELEILWPFQRKKQQK
ncbi:MAG: signal peptidase II [Lachnospiraceae bacterium]|nr:signal peptidase II [Lachnospiraceae bacterium]